MRTRVLFLAVVFCPFLVAAYSNYLSSVHLIVYNESDKEITLKVSITQTDKADRSKTISNTIKPGMQEIDAGKFSKGLYQVYAATGDGRIGTTRSISFDADKWIVISYKYNDSLSIQKKYGYVDTNTLKKIDGKYAGIDMFSDNRRPVGLQ